MLNFQERMDLLRPEINILSKEIDEICQILGASNEDEAIEILENRQKCHSA